MPYRVSLTLVGGQRTQLSDIYYAKTPSIGDKLIVNIGSRSTRAQVTSVRKHPSKSPASAVQTVDDVDAQEM
jgi:hypothetical protein